jgi:hypothetical protein
MKTIKALILAALLMGAVVSAPGQLSYENFLTTAVSCNLSTTLVHGVGFTSKSISVNPIGNTLASITVTFTRTTGTAALVDFEFTVSWDGGTTFSTGSYFTISIPTNELAASNVVRATRLFYAKGITHIRLNRIVNNDGSTNLTVCNATLATE